MPGASLPEQAMPAESLELAPWLLAGAIWAVALGISYRHFLAAAGDNKFAAGFEGGPEDLAPDGQDEIYDDFYKQLLALGFQPAGVTWEKVVGGRKIDSYAFLHPEQICRASMWRLLGADYRMYFITQFDDGAAVLTPNY